MQRYKSKFKENDITPEEFVNKQNLKKVYTVNIKSVKPIIPKPNNALLSRFESGIKVPIVVNKNYNTIEDGNHRYFGALARGDKNIDVVYIDDIPMHMNKKVIELLKRKMEGIYL